MGQIKDEGTATNNLEEMMPEDDIDIKLMKKYAQLLHYFKECYPEHILIRFGYLAPRVLAAIEYIFNKSTDKDKGEMGKRIQNLRNSHASTAYNILSGPITQAKLANALGCSTGTLSAIESKGKGLTLPYLIRIADVLSANPFVILGYTNDSNKTYQMTDLGTRRMPKSDMLNEVEDLTDEQVLKELQEPMVFESPFYVSRIDCANIMLKLVTQDVELFECIHEVVKQKEKYPVIYSIMKDVIKSAAKHMSGNNI